jgi:hypothetical protein
LKELNKKADNSEKDAKETDEYLKALDKRIKEKEVERKNEVKETADALKIVEKFVKDDASFNNLKHYANNFSNIQKELQNTSNQLIVDIKKKQLEFERNVDTLYYLSSNLYLTKSSNITSNLNAILELKNNLSSNVHYFTSNLNMKKNEIDGLMQEFRDKIGTSGISGGAADTASEEPSGTLGGAKKYTIEELQNNNNNNTYFDLKYLKTDKKEAQAERKKQAFSAKEKAMMKILLNYFENSNKSKDNDCNKGLYGCAYEQVKKARAYIKRHKNQYDELIAKIITFTDKLGYDPTRDPVKFKKGMQYKLSKLELASKQIIKDALSMKANEKNNLAPPPEPIDTSIMTSILSDFVKTYIVVKEIDIKSITDGPPVSDTRGSLNDSVIDALTNVIKMTSLISLATEDPSKVMPSARFLGRFSQLQGNLNPPDDILEALKNVASRTEIAKSLHSIINISAPSVPLASDQQPSEIETILANLRNFVVACNVARNSLDAFKIPQNPDNDDDIPQDQMSSMQEVVKLISLTKNLPFNGIQQDTNSQPNLDDGVQKLLADFIKVSQFGKSLLEEVEEVADPGEREVDVTNILTVLPKIVTIGQISRTLLDKLNNQNAISDSEQSQAGIGDINTLKQLLQNFINTATTSSQIAELLKLEIPDQEQLNDNDIISLIGKLKDALVAINFVRQNMNLPDFAQQINNTDIDAKPQDLLDILQKILIATSTTGRLLEQVKEVPSTAPMSPELLDLTIDTGIMAAALAQTLLKQIVEGGKLSDTDGNFSSDELNDKLNGLINVVKNVKAVNGAKNSIISIPDEGILGSNNHIELSQSLVNSIEPAVVVNQLDRFIKDMPEIKESKVKAFDLGDIVEKGIMIATLANILSQQIQNGGIGKGKDDEINIEKAKEVLEETKNALTAYQIAYNLNLKNIDVQNVIPDITHISENIRDAIQKATLGSKLADQIVDIKIPTRPFDANEVLELGAILSTASPSTPGPSTRGGYFLPNQIQYAKNTKHSKNAKTANNNISDNKSLIPASMFYTGGADKRIDSTTRYMSTRADMRGDARRDPKIDPNKKDDSSRKDTGNKNTLSSRETIDYSRILNDVDNWYDKYDDAYTQIESKIKDIDESYIKHYNNVVSTDTKALDEYQEIEIITASNRTPVFNEDDKNKLTAANDLLKKLEENIETLKADRSKIGSLKQILDTLKSTNESIDTNLKKYFSSVQTDADLDNFKELIRNNRRLIQQQKDLLETADKNVKLSDLEGLKSKISEFTKSYKFPQKFSTNQDIAKSIKAKIGQLARQKASESQSNKTDELTQNINSIKEKLKILKDLLKKKSRSSTAKAASIGEFTDVDGTRSLVDAETSIYNKVWDNYVADLKNPDKVIEQSQDNFYRTMKSNNLDPEEALELSSDDKIIFVIVMSSPLILIATFICQVILMKKDRAAV